ncbi:MAG TPA: DUF1109 domain-containing protein [Caulobacteraceae bacterium]|jgi:hypothetical protein
MKTGDLIELLANDAAATPPGVAWRRLGNALAAGGALTLLLVILWLRCQPLLMVAVQPWFWMKAAYTGLLTVSGVILVRRLATPGAPVRALPMWAAMIFLAMVVLGAGQLLAATPGERLGLWLGQTWRVCSPLILLLSVPIYVGLIVAVRSLAPIHPIRTGAAVGFAAGALAATLYGLHCPEQGAAFVVTWYSLGIAAATTAGGLAGRRLLRW